MDKQEQLTDREAVQGSPGLLDVREKPEFLLRIFLGPNGLRTGWSIGIFLFVTAMAAAFLGTFVSFFVKDVLHIATDNGTPTSVLIGQMVEVVALLIAAALCARIEGRRIWDYNLTGSRRLRHFSIGAVAGFAALSVLVGAMTAGGWLRFGPAALTGMQVLQFAAVWGFAFLLTGLGEEGAVRCYLLFTLSRGINFWWAIGLQAAMCLACALFIHNQGVWGVYAMAGLGVAPILWLQRRCNPQAAFWQAAWATSTFFGFIHTGNHGETWIGIFAAAAIGFVFCVSVRLTGSAWWAIGFHAAWDWAETFFYGVSDSGMIPKGHFLTTAPSGSELFSGGTDGPEGSLLVLPLIALTLLFLVLIYRSRRESSSPTARPQLS